MCRTGLFRAPLSTEIRIPKETEYVIVLGLSGFRTLSLPSWFETGGSTVTKQHAAREHVKRTPSCQHRPALHASCPHSPTSRLDVLLDDLILSHHDLE